MEHQERRQRAEDAWYRSEQGGCAYMYGGKDKSKGKGTAPAKKKALAMKAALKAARMPMKATKAKAMKAKT